MRKKINRQAICSSDNYKASRRAHLDFLREQHDHFSFLTVSGELTFDVPTVENSIIQPRFKTVKILGKEMKLTIEEYNTHYVKARLND